MTLLADIETPPVPAPELRSVKPESAREAGTVLLKALDGTLLDLSNLHCGEDVTGFLEVSGRTHYIRVTEASRPRADMQNHNLVIHHGYTERIDEGSGANVHTALARKFLESRVISIATDGVGEKCKRLGFRDALSLTFDKMAEDRVAITRRICGADAISLLGVSMGTRMNMDVAAKMVEAEDMNLVHVINLSSAQVPLAKVPIDMIARFPLHIARDGARESIRHPREATKTILGFYATLFHSGPALLGNLKNLLQGMDSDRQLQLTLSLTNREQPVPVTYIHGATDPLPQRQRLRLLAQLTNGNVGVIELSGKGHAWTLDSAAAAATVAEVDLYAVA